MAAKVFRIMARMEWIRRHLQAGRPWNASTLAAEFKTSVKTAQRTVESFRQLNPEWAPPRYSTHWLRICCPTLNTSYSAGSTARAHFGRALL